MAQPPSVEAMRLRPSAAPSGFVTSQSPSQKSRRRYSGPAHDSTFENGGVDTRGAAHAVVKPSIESETKTRAARAMRLARSHGRGRPRCQDLARAPRPRGRRRHPEGAPERMREVAVARVAEIERDRRQI